MISTTPCSILALVMPLPQVPQPHRGAGEVVGARENGDRERPDDDEAANAVEEPRDGMRALTQSIASKRPLVELAVHPAERRAGQRRAIRVPADAVTSELWSDSQPAGTTGSHGSVLATSFQRSTGTQYGETPISRAGLPLEHAQRRNRETRMLLIAKPPQSSCMSELSRDDHVPPKHQEVALGSPGSPAGDAQRRHGRNVAPHPVGLDRVGSVGGVL